MKDDTELQGITGALALVLVLIVIALTGCSTTKPAVAAEDVTKAGVVDAAIAASKAPLFKMTCAPSCSFASLEVGNPGAAAQMADVVRVAMTPAPSEASQNFRATLNALAPVLGYAVIGNAASNIMSNVVGGFTSGFASNASIANSGFASNVAIAGQIQAPAANITTTTTLSGYGVIGDGTVTAPVTTTTNPVAKVCGFSGTPPAFICN